MQGNLRRYSRRARLSREKESSSVDFVVERHERKIKKARLKSRPLIDLRGHSFLDYIYLSESFYQDYIGCAEIEQKPTRPYIRICVKINGVLFAVPMRSHIKHKHVLWTNEAAGCGLDFSKAVVITKSEYINRSQRPHIRQDEFNSLKGKEFIVRQKMEQYIRDYKKAAARLDVPRNKELCRYSTLQYFERYI